MTGSTWAVASDYSDVIETTDGFGIFPTKRDALERQIELLETESQVTRASLSSARANLRREIAKERRNG